MKYWLCLVVLILVAANPLHGGQHKIPVSAFNGEQLSEWEIKAFKGQTAYSLVLDSEQGRVLKAESDGSASGLVWEQRVNLSRTPYLNWTWKVEKLPVVENEKTKAGDDYAARIYVIFKTGPWFWNTHALNYVWSVAVPVGESWLNAFTSNARMIALQSGDDNSGIWMHEKRNVKKDIEMLFDEEIDTIEAVAVMTDTDNSGSRAVAFYGEIYFSRK